MTKARQDFIDHLKLRGFSNCTIDNYIENISLFARFFNKAPDLLCNDHVKQYLLHLLNDRKLQAVLSTFTSTVFAGTTKIFVNDPK